MRLLTTHNSRGRRNFCPPTLEGGDPPRSLRRRLKDGGVPRSAQKIWVDNIFDPWHVSRRRRDFCPPASEGGEPPRFLHQRLKDGGIPRSAQKRVGGQYFRSPHPACHSSRGHRNFCPPTLEGGNPPKSLCRHFEDGGLPRSVQKTVGGQYFRSLAWFPRTSQFLSTYLGWRRSAKLAFPTPQGWRTAALRTKKSRWTIFSIPGTAHADTAIFVHLPWRAEIRQGRSVDDSRTADCRAPRKKEWVDNIFDPRHGSRLLHNPLPIDIVAADQEQRRRKKKQQSERQKRRKNVRARDRTVEQIGSVSERQTVGNRA